MDIVRFECETCHTKLKSKSDKCGQRFKCPKCGSAMTIPFSGASSEGSSPSLPAIRSDSSQPSKKPTSIATRKSSQLPDIPAMEEDRAFELIDVSRPTRVIARAEITLACPFCGEQVLAAARKCKHCGEFIDEDERKARQPQVAATPQIVIQNLSSPPIETQNNAFNPGIAALLSFVLPGIGQMYRHQVGSGIIWLIAAICGYAINPGVGAIVHLASVGFAAAGGRGR